MMSKHLVSFLVLAAFGAGASAKLPAPVLDDAAKSKAAETTAKLAWQAKVDAYQLCKTQDRIAAKVKGGAKAPTATPVSTAAAPATPAAAPATSAGAPATSAAAPATPAAGGAAPASTPAATPVAAAPPAPCVEPGPFAFNPPQQKPLETSGAHSPTGTAGSPPSVRPESAKMIPAKPSTAPGGGSAAK